MDKVESDRKKDGYDLLFEKAWVAFGRIGDKPNAALEWGSKVDDPELVIACIPKYLEDCKRTDTPVQHFHRWLKGLRWDQFAHVKEKVAQKRACEECGQRPRTHKKSFREDGQWCAVWICDECN